MSLLGGLIQKAQQRASQVYDQINPLDNGLSYQTRQINPTVAPQSVVRQSVNVAQPIVNMTGVPSVVDAARLATAEATHNQAAAGAATQRLAVNLPQFLPISMAEGIKPFAQDVASTVLSPYANHVANQQADYARRMLNNNTGNRAHDAAVEAYANSIKQNFYQDQLARSGINPNDSNGAIARKVVGHGANAGANVVMAELMAANPAALAAKTLPGAARGAAAYGGLNATMGAAQTAQGDNPHLLDYLNAAAKGAAMGAALPLAGYAARAGAPLAARGAAAGARDLKAAYKQSPLAHEGGYISTGADGELNTQLNQLARTAKSPTDFAQQAKAIVPEGLDTQRFYEDVQKEVGLENTIRSKNPNLVVKPEDTPTTKQITLENIDQQANKQYQDTGAKMFGSRKDMAKFARVSQESLPELEAQGDRVADTMVTKQRVFGDTAKYTPNLQGDPALENLKHTVISSIPGKPAARTADARAMYVKELPTFLEAIRNAPNPQAVQDAMSQFVRGEPKVDPATGRTLSTYDRQYTVKQQLGSKFYNVLRGNSEAVRRAIYRPPSDFSWAEKKAVAPRTAGGESLHGGELMPYVRVNDKSIGNLTPEQIKNTFNLKGMEYGNYVKDAEAQQHIQRFGEALHDMEQLTGLDASHLIKEMNLGIGFGSRGHSSALAHYEPSTKVINITKKEGADGTLAHEFAHALDDWLGNGKPGEYATDGKAPSPAIRQAFGEVQKAIRTGNSTYTVHRTGGVLNFSSLDKYITDNPNESMAAITQRYPHESLKRINQVAQYVMAKTKSEQVDVPSNKSAFYQAAANKGGYWQKPTELFARAFADYLRVKADDAGIKNNYLTRTEPGTKLFSPDNMDVIRPAMDSLLATIKSDKGIATAPERGNPQVTAAKSTLKTMTSSLDAQKYATFDSFYKDYKSFFDDNNINDVQARSIYDKAQQAPVAISKSGTARSNAELQAQIEAAHNAGDTAREAELNKQLPDQAMSSTPGAMSADRRAELMAKMRANVAKQAAQPHDSFADHFKLNESGKILVKDAEQAAPKAKVSPDVNKYIKEQTAKQDAARKGNSFISQFGREFKTKFVDSLSPIEDTFNKAVKDNHLNIDPTKNIKYQLDRAIRGDTLGAQYIHDNGLAKIIQSVPDTKKFDQYLIARHAADLTKQGILTGRDAKMDAALVKQLKGEYEPYAKQVGQYSHKLLDSAVNYGLISKELAASLKKQYPNYVPMNRVFNQDELSTFKGNGSGKASISQQSVIKKIKGSERNVESPLSSLIDKSITLVKEGERNKAAQLLTGYRKLPGNPFDLRELAKSETVGTKPVISVLENGKVRRFETSKEIADAAKSLTKEQLGLVGKVLSVPTRVLRLGATSLNPAFALANVAKDSVSAFINGEHALRASAANPKVFVYAFKAAMNHQSAEYGELVRQGAGGTSFDIARNAARQNVGLIRAERSRGTKVAYNVTHPLALFRAAEDTIGRSEEFNRAIQYFGNKQAGLKKGMTVKNAQVYGANAARNNTVNFARAGDYGRVLNSALPYLNAGIQGSRTFIRALKDRPAQTTAKLVATVFVPTATVTAWNLSDKNRKAAYDDIPDYEKQNNIIIIPPNPKKDPKTGRWNAIKIPVSQEIANLNDVVRGGVEKSFKDGNLNAAQVVGNLIGSVTSLNTQSPRQVVGQLTPQAIKPAVETLTNSNLFTGNKIVPDSQKNLQPQDQYGQYTSGTAKTVGKATHTSPRQIDNAIRTTFGGLGQNVVHYADQGLAKLGVISPNEVQGRSFPDAVQSRFYGAQGKSDYQKASDKTAEAQRQLQNDPRYKAMSPDDKVKAMNRFSRDTTAVYIPKKDGSATTLNDHQKALQNGKPDLSYYLNGTTPATQKKAALDDFKKSGKQTTTIDGQFYYKDGAGKPQSMSKVEYDYNQKNSQLQLAMDSARNSGDVKSWLNLAQQRMQTLEDRKKQYNPKTQADKLNNITLEQQNLAQDIAKYQTQGGFTKAKKTGSVSRSQKTALTAYTSDISKSISDFAKTGKAVANAKVTAKSFGSKIAKRGITAYKKPAATKVTSRRA